ncbi:MAG: LLM class flavin-dependent oxidoreductase, partial [Actinomycetes bacterium]
MQADFGIYLPPVGLSYPDLVDRARRCEAYGYQSLWLFDHLSAPGLPDLPSFEGWTLATALATATAHIRVGHLVLCNSFRHPAVLAKMATSLDLISGGRLDFGIGSGSWPAEHAQAGMPWGTLAERSERLAETLEIVTGAWASPRFSFHGRHYQVTDLPHLPSPVQDPHPPIFVGGIG